MPESYTATGTLADGRTVVLDEELPVHGGRVRLVIEPIAAPQPKRPVAEVLEEIWERQRRRGFDPPSSEEVDAYIRAERESWDE